MKMSAPLKFGVKFVLVFFVLAAAFEASRGSRVEHFVVVDLILVPTTDLINVVTPRDPVELTGRTFVTPTTRMHVTRGCEGIELFLLLAAALAAFPARLMHKAGGLLVGSVLAYVLSVTRLMVLDYTLRYVPRGWEAMHGLIMPLVPVIVMALYFLRWTGKSNAPRRLGEDPHTA